VNHQRQDYINYRIARSFETFEDAKILYNDFIVFDESIVIPLINETEKFIRLIKNKIEKYEKSKT
jgi:hypothetical protein